jgi:maltooligosyltrehalose synthase
VFPFAPQNTYGGPKGLKRLVNACHQKGLAVILDVVYNHLGPEENYFREFGPYFTDQYRTPWGDAINFDGTDSDEVRRYFIENALQWATEFHIDALRLDAVHAIMDMSARPFLSELADRVREQSDLLDRKICLIGESNRNDPALVRRSEAIQFETGDYLPLHASSEHNVVAFARRADHRWAIVAVPRLFSNLTRGRTTPVGPRVWGEHSIVLPDGAPDRWENVFIGETVEASTEGGTRVFRLGVFASFPFSILKPMQSPAIPSVHERRRISFIPYRRLRRS